MIEERTGIAMRVHKQRISAVCSALLGLGLLLPAALGQTVTIVVPRETDRALTEAASDLKQCLKRSAAFEAAITDAHALKGHLRILVGAGAQGVTESDLPPKDAGAETLRIRRRGDVIVIAGRDPVATANGVYTFIQKHLGVRWFIPGPMGEYVPPRKRGEIFDNISDEIISPVFSPRHWEAFSNPKYGPASWRVWARRNRLDSPPLAAYMTADSFNTWLPRFWQTPGVKEHEEFYPLVNGKRRVVDPFGKLPQVRGTKQRRWTWAPCWSNLGLVEIVAENCREYFEKHPNVTTVSLGLDDVDIYCECKPCRDLDGGVRPSFRGDASNVSNRFYWLLNQVASRLAKTHPDKFIKTLIYKNVRAVPSTIDRLQPNIVGVLAASTASVGEWRVEAVRRKEIAQSTAWSKICSRLGRWEYLGLAEPVPRYFPHLLDDGIKFDAAHNITIVGPNSTRALLPNVVPMFWAAQQLYWQSHLDINDLLDEFFTGFFAESAAPMKDYFDFTEELWLRPDRAMFGGYSGIRSSAQFMSEEHLRRAERLLDQARARAESEDTANKVEVFARAFEIGAILTRTYARATAVERLPIIDRATAAATLAETIKASAFCLTRDARWNDITGADDLTGESLRALDTIPYASINHRRKLDLPFESAFVRAVLHLARNHPTDLAAFAEDAGKTGPDSRLGKVAGAVADAERPAVLVEDANFWKERLGYEVDLEEDVTDRLNLVDLANRDGLITLFDWADPGDAQVTPKDFPAFDKEEEQAAIAVNPPEIEGGSYYTAVLTIPEKTPTSWQWPAVTLTELAITDWSAFAGIAVGFHNPTGEGEEVGICIRDKDKSSWQAQTRLAPGQTKILSVPMDDISETIALENILAFTIWTRRPQHQQRFHVTPVFLVKPGRYERVDLIDRSSGNGGFEKGAFDGWKPETKGEGTIELTTDDACEGKHAARIRNFGDQDDLAVLSLTLPGKELDKNRIYRLSFAAKPISGRCRVTAAGGPTAPHSHVSKWLDREPGWKRYSFTIGYVHPDGQGPGTGTDVPLNWRHLGIQFYGDRPFELMIDDVKLEPK